MANFCENCGAPLTPGERFCQKCGTPVEQAGMQYQQPSQPQYQPQIQPPPQIRLNPKRLEDLRKLPRNLHLPIWLDLLVDV